MSKFSYISPRSHHMEVELGLGIGAGTGSGQLRGDSVTGNKEIVIEIGSGRVEVGTDLTHIEDNLFCEEEAMADEEIEWEEEDTEGDEEDTEGDEEDTKDEEEEDEDESTLPFRSDQNQNIERRFVSPVNSEESPEDILMEAMLGTSLMELDYEDFLAVFPKSGVSHEDYYDIFVQVFVLESPTPTIGSRPASQKVVDDLHVVEISSEELSNMKIVCAICIDDVVVEEKITRLACWHYYHEKYILLWLGMKNTCSVCWYELPTDDLES